MNLLMVKNTNSHSQEHDYQQLIRSVLLHGVIAPQNLQTIISIILLHVVIHEVIVVDLGVARKCRCHIPGSWILSTRERPGHRNLTTFVLRVGDKDGLLPKQMEHYLCPRPVERVIALSANAKMERNRRYK